MTHNRINATCIRIASASLLAATLVLGTAATAGATKPYNGEEGEGAFVSCFQELINHEGPDEATFDCCIITGGSWSSPNDYHHGFCIWPPADSQSGNGRGRAPVVISRGAPMPTRQLS